MSAARSYQVDDTFGEFKRDSEFAYWNRYAAVNDKFLPIHMEDAAGQAADYPTAFGMGNLTWAYLHFALHRWLGDEARIVALETQFRAAVTRGKRVGIAGTITSVEPRGSDTHIQLTLRAEDDSGGLLAPGSATVALTQSPLLDGNR